MKPFVLTVIFITQMSHGNKMNQSLLKVIYPNQSAIIVCEHSEQSEEFEEFRLYSVSGSNKTILCQKRSSDCRNVFYQVSPRKVVFLLFNMEEKAMQVSYQCEFILKKDKILDHLYGDPSTILPVQKKTRTQSTMPPPPLSSPPHPPLPPKTEAPLLMWILIGLLVLMLLYSGFVTCCCIRLMSSDKDGGAPVYVEMRKLPLSQHTYYKEKFGATIPSAPVQFSTRAELHAGDMSKMSSRGYNPTSTHG